MATENRVSWVSRPERVVARYADGAVRGWGRVIAHTDRPTFVIECDDGSRFSWIADMCEIAAPPEWDASDLDERDMRYWALPPDSTLQQGPYCDARFNFCSCTRPPSHTGRHAAGDGERIVAAWGAR